MSQLPHLTALHAMQELHGGVVLEVTESEGFCDVHEAPLSVLELVTAAGAVFRRTACPLYRQLRCSYQESTRQVFPPA